MAFKLHGARRLTVQAWSALMEAEGSVVMTSGNSALFPRSGYAAVGTINAAIVALAKAFADKGLTDGVVNVVAEFKRPLGYESKVLFAERLPVSTMDVERWISSTPTHQVKPLTGVVAMTYVPVTLRGFAKMRAARLQARKNRWEIRDRFLLLYATSSAARSIPRSCPYSGDRELTPARRQGLSSL